ncbi:MAG: hypothetical protein ACREFZ_02425 [Acetobacteraceae bacterium]
MRKSWFLAGGTGATALAVALYVGLIAYPAAQLRHAIETAERALPPGTSLRYKNASYSVFSGRATLHHVALQVSGPVDPDVTIDTVVLEHPSLSLAREWQRAKTNPTAFAPAESLPLAAGMTLTGIRIQIGKTERTIGMLHVEGLRVYPAALFHSGVPSWPEVESALNSAAPAQSLSGLVPIAHFAAAWALGVGYSAYSAENITGTIDVPATPDLAARHVSYHVATVSGLGNDRGIFGPSTAEQIVIHLGKPAGTFTIAEETTSGLRMRKPLERMLTATTLSPAMLDGFSLGHFALAGMSLKPPAAPALALGAFSLSDLRLEGGVPVSAAIAWHGVRVTSADMPTPEAETFFKLLGLDKLTIGLRAGYRWDLAQKTVSLDNWIVRITELGSLRASLSLADVSPTRDAVKVARLKHLVLRYTDASLAQRVLAAGAASDHTSPAAFRHNLIAAVRKQAQQFAVSPRLVEAADAIIAFIKAPHSLTITLAPPTPVPLASLDSTPSANALPDLASSLGLSVAAN